MEYFLKKNGSFSKMITNGETVKREKVLGKSRIDFATVDTFLEVKTLMNQIPIATEHKCFVPYKKTIWICNRSFNKTHVGVK